MCFEYSAVIAPKTLVKMYLEAASCLALTQNLAIPKHSKVNDI